MSVVAAIVARALASARSDQDGAVRQGKELRSARVESLRAIAALAVVEGHLYGDTFSQRLKYDTWWHRTLFGGGFSVYLFFSLTGYLLFLPFARQSFGSGRRADVARYARNRALRILPLYYAVAITCLAVYRQPVGVWVTFLLFGENFRSSTVVHVNGPMWSLVVEVLFYILLPFFAMAMAWLTSRSLRRAVVAMVLLGAGAGFYRWWVYLRPLHPSALVRYNLPATFFFFVPGMLLALLKVGTENWPPERRLRGLLGSGWLWLAASLACWAFVFQNYRHDLLCGAGSFFLLGACVLPVRQVAPVRALGWRPLAGLGVASYSLYLWHMPIVSAMQSLHLGPYPVRLLVVVAICVAAAAASYRIIEAPFLRLRSRWGDTAARDIPAPTPAGSG